MNRVNHPCLGLRVKDGCVRVAKVLRVCLWVLVCVVCVDACGQELLVRDAWVADPMSETVRKGSILIQEGVIRGIFDEAPGWYDGKVVEASGKYVIPGLNDMHVHSYGNEGQYLGTEGSGRAMLYCGVTGFLDLFNAEDYIFDLRGRQRREGLEMADIYAAGPILTATGGHGTEYGVPTRTMDTPEEARTQVAELSLKNPDVVKLVYERGGEMPTIDRETMAAAVEAASSRGKRTVVHIMRWDDTRDALLAGVSAFTHMGKEGGEGEGMDVPEVLIGMAAERGVYCIPTLAVLSGWVELRMNPEPLRSPLLRSVATPAALAWYGENVGDAPAEPSEPERAWLVTMYRNLERLSDGGVKIMVGTDAGNRYTFQGYTVHTEMRMMVDAGMSEWEVLRAATVTPGEFLGRRFGVRAGDVANLVVLNASPIDEIRNTEDISAVIYRGAVVDRAALRESLVGEE